MEFAIINSRAVFVNWLIAGYVGRDYEATISIINFGLLGNILIIF
jgi:hypothetical protein